MQNYDFSTVKIASETAKQVLLGEKEAAERLSLSPQALRLWRKRREQGLEAPVIPFVKLGRLVKYRQVDVDQFLMEQLYAN
jgi:hypothetical protein|tara:strand:- start:92 stop:334 length:243 start_codon:yes stop_codon:yes gene_type:complete